MTKELNTKSVLSEGKCEAMDIAKVLLANDPERKYFTNTSKGHMRLQTMLHISQMLYCSKTGKPLFKDPMYAYPPRYDLLTKGRLERVSKIIHSKDFKGDKHEEIYKIYKEQKIKFDKRDEELYWGRERYEERKAKGIYEK